MRKLTKITLASSLMLGGCLYASHLLNSPEANASENTKMSSTTTKYPSKAVNFYVKADDNAVTFNSFNFDEDHIRIENHWNLNPDEQYIVKRVYDLSNSDYFGMKDVYSIYSSINGEWLGYGTPDNFTKTDSKGKYFTNDRSQKYVEVKSDNYNLIKNLNDFKVLSHSKVGEKYVAKGHYKHINGSTYQSLYQVNKDNNDLIWKGYINDKALTHLSNDFGTLHQVSNGKIKITQSNYGIYKDKAFQNKVGTSQKYLNKTLTVKGYYDRFSKHERYVSIYDGDTWLGYVQVKAGTVNFK